MNEAIKEIEKDRDYHLRQFEENKRKIEQYKDSIRILEEANIKEERLLKQFNEVLDKIKSF
ncbi:hypothetical protein [Bacillus litorisediminis]|uniref:hypothetical protein n=1 Tax=Bacillus litorisediminis TaxID=2922713 RepID=UPI001FAC5DB1|nr:hypothetical protein [Bacillus litorisediminis]